MGMKKLFYLSLLFPMFCSAEIFIKIPANPNFNFARGLERNSAGEKSPILTPFEIAKFPITNAEYRQFLKSNPKIKPPKYWGNGTFPKGKEKHPVVDVSLVDAKEYCKWLSSRDKKYSYRIPTEAEWEFAAVGNTGNKYPWGNDVGDADSSKFNYNGVILSILLKKNPSQKVKYIHPKSSEKNRVLKLSDVVSLKNGRIKGWIDHKNHTGFVYTDLFKSLSDEGGYTTPVDKYPQGKSPFGVFDMSGNSWDWTDSVITAKNGAKKGKSVNAVRGGSWYATSRSCEAIFRGEGRNAKGSYNTVGFRIVRHLK